MVTLIRLCRCTCNCRFCCAPTASYCFFQKTTMAQPGYTFSNGSQPTINHYPTNDPSPPYTNVQVSQKKCGCFAFPSPGIAINDSSLVHVHNLHPSVCFCCRVHFGHVNGVLRKYTLEQNCTRELICSSSEGGAIFFQPVCKFALGCILIIGTHFCVKWVLLFSFNIPST